MVKKDSLTELGEKIKELGKDIFKELIFEEFIALNAIECRGDSLKSFLSLLNGININVGNVLQPSLSLII